MKSKTKKKTVELREICSACRLPIGPERKSSLTGWIFGTGQCKCESEKANAYTSESKQIADQQVEKTDQSATKDHQQEQAVLHDGSRDKDTFYQTAHHKYQIIEELGAGGMGMVYKVKDEQLDQTFALKVLRAELTVDPLAIERFGKEVHATESLSHAHIATVYDSGVDQSGRPFYVMEFVEGQTLAEFLKEQNTLPLDRLFDIAGQICEALSHAHQHGIIHRDLKPSNIMLKANDSEIDLVKVVDFGIAKIVPPPGKDTMSLTKTGEIFGSPMYMSPEQCQGERLDVSSDIYSLGCLMYECVAGRAPFQNANPVKVILSHIYEKPLSPRNWRPSLLIPEVVSDVIMNCLEKDPNVRYQSMDELKGDLDRLANDSAPKLSTNLNRAQKRKALKWKVAKYSPLAILALILLLVGTYAVDLQTFLEYPGVFGGVVSPEKLLKSSDKQNVPFVLLASAGNSYIRGKLEDSRDKSKQSAKLFEQRGDYIDRLYAQAVWAKAETASGNFEQANKIAESAISVVRRAQSSTPAKGFRLIGWWYLPTAEDWEQPILQIGAVVSDQYPSFYRDVLEQLDKKSLPPGNRIRLEMRCATSMYKAGQVSEARQFILPLLSSWKSHAKDEVVFADLAQLTMECFQARDTDTLEKLAEFAQTSPPSQLVIALSDTIDKKPGADARFQKAFASRSDVEMLANRLYNAGRIDAVEVLFENFLKSTPNDQAMKLQYAKFLSGRGEKEKAFNLRREIVEFETTMRNADKKEKDEKDSKAKPLDESSFKQLISSAYTDKSFDEAEQMCRFVLKGHWKTMIEQHPDYSDPAVNVGIRDNTTIDQELALAAISVRQGQGEAAYNKYNQIIADEASENSERVGINSSSRTKAKIAKANLCRIENKNGEAEAILKDVLQSDQSRTITSFVSGLKELQMYLTQKSYSSSSGRAEALLKEALQSNQSQAVIPLVRLYEDQGRYPEAADILSKSIDPASLGRYDEKLLNIAMRIFERVEFSVPAYSLDGRGGWSCHNGGKVDVLPGIRKRLDYLKRVEPKQFQECPTWEEMITLSDNDELIVKTTR